jgi:hypothetical protein
MDVELTWLYEEFNRAVDMQQIEEDLRESEEFLRRWEAGDLTDAEHEALDEELAQSEIAQDASLYERFAVGAYLLLRQHVGDPWRHDLDLDTIVARDGKLYWANPGRHRALSDSRWLLHVDGDLWHDAMLEVLRWVERYGIAPQRLMGWLEDEQPRLRKWLHHFKVNARRRRHLIQEFPADIPEGYVVVHDDPERTEEKPPPQGFRVPPTHSWRYQYLAYDPFEALDLEVDVRWALARLGEVDRYLFIRHFAYGDTARSLAVDIPRGTVNKKLVTAMRRVREYLNETPPKKRGRPPKKNIENGYSNDPKSCLTIQGAPWGVADALSRRQNGVGLSPHAAPRESSEQYEIRCQKERKWRTLALSADDRESWQRKVLKWREEGTHKEKLFWRSLRYGTVR